MRLAPATTRAVSSALLLAACSGVPEGVVGRCESDVALPAAVTTDILFVVDNSSSMSQEQAKVVAQLSAFLDSLANAPVQNDFQVGVISTAVTMYANLCGANSILTQAEAEAGRLQLGKDLAGNPNPASQRKLLSYDDPDLLEQFGLLIGQGTAGLGQEMALEAMRRALTEPLLSVAPDATPAGNAGFLRPGSRLLVVIVTDEDDCSASNPQALLLRSSCTAAPCTVDADCGGEGIYCVVQGSESARACELNSCETPEGRATLESVTSYVDFLKTLDDGTGSNRQREVSLAVIGPVNAQGEPERCESSSDEAFGVGRRYQEAVSLMGERGFIGSICNDEYGTTLRQIAELVAAPQVLELAANPPDGNLIRVTVERAGVAPIECKNGDGFVFEPGVDGTPARLVMQDRCRLRGDDRISVRFICAG
ncbi:MAG TPA: vWA domain-containing protein [Polyangiaceae bacterium]|nr:vWA domain-containing protein [Polyangiaceae bacterium]